MLSSRAYGMITLVCMFLLLNCQMDNWPYNTKETLDNYVSVLNEQISYSFVSKIAFYIQKLSSFSLMTLSFIKIMKVQRKDYILSI